MSTKRNAPKTSSARQKNGIINGGRPGLVKKGRCSQKHILIVDDEAIFAKMCKRILTQAGFEVTAITDPLRALEQFQSNPFDYDLAIIDKSMPNLDGYELAEKLVEIRAGIPVIIASGYREELENTKRKSTIIRGYATKPISGSDLVAMIDTILQ